MDGKDDDAYGFPLFCLLLCVSLSLSLSHTHTQTHTLREEHRLGLFENRVLRKIFGPKRDKVAGN
jgi:hypothetical protein